MMGEPSKPYCGRVSVKNPKRRVKPKLPRAPLPRQTEKIHQKKSKDRKIKHPRAFYDEWAETIFNRI